MGWAVGAGRMHEFGSKSLADFTFICEELPSSPVTVKRHVALVAVDRRG